MLLCCQSTYAYGCRYLGLHACEVQAAQAYDRELIKRRGVKAPYSQLRQLSTNFALHHYMEVLGEAVAWIIHLYQNKSGAIALLDDILQHVLKIGTYQKPVHACSVPCRHDSRCNPCNWAVQIKISVSCTITPHPLNCSLLL